MDKHLEIERKYIIKYPDIEFLRSLSGVEEVRIVQDYLTHDEKGFGRRIRIWDDGKERYFYTRKKKLRKMVNLETEEEVSKDRYEELLAKRDKSRNTIRKTRFRIPDNGHIFEIDVFEFWKNQAYLEIELESEDESFDIPQYIEVIREVTGDGRYTNGALSVKIPKEDIPE